MLRVLPVCLVLCYVVVGCAKPGPPLIDRGADGLDRDPYAHRQKPQYDAKGHYQGFMTLYVDATDVSALRPIAPDPSAGSTLAIHNDTSAWATIRVSDTKVGVIGPLVVATIHDLTPGTYRVQLTLPNGYTQTHETLTD